MNWNTLIGFKVFWLSLLPNEWGDGQTLVLQLDPKLYNIELTDLKDCSTEKHMVFNKAYGAINAGMFYGTELDGGLWINGLEEYPARKKNMFGRIIFGDTVAINMDMTEDLGEANYTTGFRMMKDGVIRWREKNKIWSMSVMGKDKDGLIYLIHSRTPYTVQHLSEQLRDELGLTDIVYLEGGPESSLSLPQVSSFGSYETDFFESDDNDFMWDIPYAWVVVPK